MKNAFRALAVFALLLLPSMAVAQCSAPLSPNVVMGRLGINPGPCQSIPFSTFGASILGNGFIQFAGPAAPTKTFTLPNVSGTVALLNQIQTWTAAQSFGVVTASSVAVAGCTMPGGAVVCATGNFTSSTGFIGPQVFGGTATNQSLTVASTTSGSNSGDALNLYGSTVTIGNQSNAPSIINLNGAVGGGTTVNIAAAGNGLNALNVFNSVGGKQVWVPGAGSGTAPGTIQFPAGNLTLATLTGTETFSNKSIAAPQLTGTLQAAQEPAHTGDCTNTAGALALTCLKTNGVSFTAGATAAAGQLPGEPSTGNASAGNVGEYIGSTVAVGTPVALTTSAVANMTSISLPAGDWDVTLSTNYIGGATTTVSFFESSISLVSATQDRTDMRVASIFYNNAAIFGALIEAPLIMGPSRFSLSTTTTIFAVVRANFATSTCSVYGTLRARRVR